MAVLANDAEWSRQTRPLAPRAHGRQLRLVDEPHDHAARDECDHGRHDEGKWAPHPQQDAASDECPSQCDAAHHVLRALRATVRAGSDEIRVQTAVGRLVDVVRQAEREEDESSRPEVGHEGEQREGERERDDRERHVRAPPTERGARRVRKRADDQRQDEREDPLRAENEADQRVGGGETPEDRRQVGGDGRHRPCEPERADAERPDQRPLCVLRQPAVPTHVPERRAEGAIRRHRRRLPTRFWS